MHKGTILQLLSCLLCSASALPSPQTGASATSNATSGPPSANGPFEEIIDSGIRHVQETYPRISLWEVFARPPRGPSVRPSTFTRITLWAYQRNIDTLIEISNQQDNPTGWSELRHISSEGLNIKTWRWVTPPVTFERAFRILREQMMAPVTNILLWQFFDGPQWGPEDQQYYAFFVDQDPDHAWWVGSMDGVLYPPHPLDPGHVEIEPGFRTVPDGITIFPVDTS